MHDDHDHGLAHDLAVMERMMARRRALKWFAGAGTVALVAGCGGSDASTGTTTPRPPPPAGIIACSAPRKRNGRPAAARSWRLGQVRLQAAGNPNAADLEFEEAGRLRDEIRQLEQEELGLPVEQKKAPLMGRSNEGKPGTRKTRFGKTQRKFGGKR